MIYSIVRSEDYLKHHGILGMRWGIWNDETRARRLGQKEQKIAKKAKRSIKGKNVTLYERKPIFSKLEDETYYTIRRNSDLKRVGSLFEDNTDHVNNKKDSKISHLDYIGIAEKYQRKGYGSETMDLYIQDCIDRGKEAIILEAAGVDPAARHIYEKMGFEAYSEMIKSDIWNDLLPMRKGLK